MKYKAFPTQWKAGGAEGEIEAWVSVYGNVDSYGDRVMFGAFKDSIAQRWPALVWQHDLKKPIGKTISIEEVAAGDPRLPDNIRDHGALLAKGALNMNVQDGRDAWEHVKFGSVNQYSFGYEEVKVTPLPDGTKELNAVELYEWSPVTIGANPLTQTQSIKSLNLESKIQALSALVDNAEEHALAFADMRSKAGRVLNSRIRSMILSLADQLTEASKSLYALHKETDPANEMKARAELLAMQARLLNINRDSKQ
jgi:HK97 family phage prohead protease